ncbi:MAG: signal peptidase I [Bacilli bacterium]|nr:signal peptidase I [Bacilli bacterium]
MEKREGKIKKFFKAIGRALTSKKARLIYWPIFYAVAIVGICISSGFIFHNTYYVQIFVSGTSMMPTLNGWCEYKPDQRNIVNFGIADCHKSAIDNVKRFDVVLTYYDFGEKDEVFKIKRIWGLPGDTISLTHDDNSYTFKVTRGNELVQECVSPYSPTNNRLSFSTGDKTFSIKINPNSPNSLRVFDSVVLDQNHFFVMGDNWTGSQDSYTLGKKPIELHNLSGVVVAIEGTAQRVGDSNTLQNKVYKNPLINF